jgi:hypothetical protein
VLNDGINIKERLTVDIPLISAELFTTIVVEILPEDFFTIDRHEYGLTSPAINFPDLDLDS